MAKSGINLDLIPLSLNSTELDCLLILLSRGQATTAKTAERTLQMAYLFEYAQNVVDPECRQALKDKYKSAWSREEWMDSYMEAKGIKDDYWDGAFEEYANGGIKAYGDYLLKDDRLPPFRAEQKRLRLIKVVNDKTNLKIPSHTKIASSLEGLRDKQYDGFKLITQNKATNEWHLLDGFYLSWLDRRTGFLKEMAAKPNPYSAVLLDFYLYTDSRKDYHSLYVKHINELKRIMK
jgi:hypothetical protein